MCEDFAAALSSSEAASSSTKQAQKQHLSAPLKSSWRGLVKLASTTDNKYERKIWKGFDNDVDDDNNGPGIVICTLSGLGHTLRC